MKKKILKWFSHAMLKAKCSKAKGTRIPKNMERCMAKMEYFLTLQTSTNQSMGE